MNLLALFFSVAAHPSVRSYEEPEGYDRLCPKTWWGNLLAFRSFILLRHGRRHNRPCGKEQPRLSKMAWMKAWKALLRLGFEESVVASCQFDSPHKTEFRLITYGLDSNFIDTRCPGGHQHVKIEGALTKPSAVYTWSLSRHFATAFAKAIDREKRTPDDLDLDITGGESLIVNDLLVAKTWSVASSWSWARKSHINVLEANAGVAVLAKIAKTKHHVRSNCLLDSAVAKGALAKGRSTSSGLQSACKRATAIQAVCEIYPGWNFAPTRLNVADDPTRAVKVRTAAGRSIVDHLTQTEMQKLHAPGLARWSSNWARLSILLIILSSSVANGEPCDFTSTWGVPVDLDFGNPPSARSTFCLHDALLASMLPLAWISVSLLGFCISCRLLSASSSLSHRLVHIFPGLGKLVSFPLGWTLVVVAGFSLADAMEPISAAEELRASARAGKTLVATRVARTQTLDLRAKLLDDFKGWLFQEHGILLSTLLTMKPPDVEEISRCLVMYGEALFSAGKAYGKFAETINSVAAARPILRKGLVAAWDFAFAWLADEPFSHHPAMPLAVLLALMTAAISWGWPLEAAVLGLAWTGLLRIGEVFLALREDLILPSDAAPGTVFALLRIRAPKTRGRAARHQAARIDPPDIIRLLTAVWGDQQPTTKLWP